jgi:hypothetical protein
VEEHSWTEDGGCGGGGRLREEELKLKSDDCDAKQW